MEITSRYQPHHQCRDFSMKTHFETFDVLGPKLISISQIINFCKMASTKLLYQEGFSNTDTHGYVLRFSYIDQLHYHISQRELANLLSGSSTNPQRHFYKTQCQTFDHLLYIINCKCQDPKVQNLLSTKDHYN